jgi:hypothetical protein
MAERAIERRGMSWGRPLLAILLITGSVLSCVACGSSGAAGRPKAMRGDEGRLQRCPRSGTSHRESEDSFAKKTLVPPSTRSALICRYQGRRTAGPRPAPEAEVLHAGSRRFARLLDAFEQLEPARRGAVACPTGRPLRYLVAFHYRNQSDDRVRVDFNGCGLVTNDALKTAFYPDDQLLRLLR